MNSIQILRLLYQKKVSIITFVLVIAVLSFILSSIMPQVYKAQTTILPPLEDEGMFNFASLISDLPLKALGLGSISSGTELFIAILESRTIMDTTINKFDLIKRFRSKDREKALKKLKKHIAVNLDDEGTITLAVEAETPWFSGKTKKDEARVLSRNMTNFLIEELDRINRRLRSERGKNTRIYIERRYQQNLDDLRQAEENLRTFQEEHGILYLPEQTQATISTAAGIKAQIIAKEVEFEISNKILGSTNSQSLQLKKEVDILNQKYHEFKFGKEDKKYMDNGSVNDLFLPFDEVPELGIEYLRLYREMLLQEKLLEFTLPQYEQARIQELKDTPTLQVLDKAVTPIKKYRPKRIIIVIFYSFLTFLLMSAYLVYKPALVTFIDDIKQTPQ